MKTVLIVEDHADIRRLIRMTLELEDCEILEAPDAAVGLEMISRVRPHVVFLDWMMPGGSSGLDICHAVKSDPALAAVKVVLVSARGSSADREAGLRAGADEYFVKPFSPIELLACVTDVAGEPQ
ncbi:MAG: response regulator transcription factor [Pseudomonadota bacterium]